MPLCRNGRHDAPDRRRLGATVTPGSTPRLVTDTGFTRELGADGDLEGDVERLLKRTFFLDRLTRTEGFYRVDLNERTALEPDLAPDVGLDFADLYGRSIGARLEAYLDVPDRTIEAHAPRWKLTAYVTPTASNVESVPFLANDLVTVTTPTAEPTGGSATQAAAVDGFLRRPSSPSAGPDATPDPAPAPGTGTFTRSADTQSGQPGPDRTRTYVRPPETDALEQAWVGPGTPIGASKALEAAYRNRLSRGPLRGTSASPSSATTRGWPPSATRSRRCTGPGSRCRSTCAPTTNSPPTPFERC
ncbi:hypothetical protein [Halobellus salinus]|uniref:hypothetical protein n=1 Tax=Halobellus salinus TaxID=931585 RepID=UPI001666E324|nr:hypothetical protein [Halobellus salinus]